MIAFLLFALFFVQFGSRALGFDLGIAPGLSIKNVFLYLILVILAVETALTRYRKLELLPVLVPFTMYIIYAAFSLVVVLLIADDPNFGYLQAVMSLKSGPLDQLLVLLIFFYGLTDPSSGLRVLRAMIWLVIAGNVVSIIDVLNIVDLGIVREEHGRIGGTVGNANEFAAFAGFSLPAIIALYMTSVGIRRKLIAVGAFLSGLAFVMAVSRGAIVGIAIGSLIGAWYLRSQLSARLLARSVATAFVASSVVVVAAFATGYGEILLDRFGQFEGNVYDASSGRTVIWSKALSVMLDEPWSFVTGFGWNAYQNAHQLRFAAHNTYLDILFNLGIVGVGLYLLVFLNILRVLRAGLQRAEPEARPFIIALIFGLLSLLVTIFFGQLYAPWLYIWAIIGIALRLAVNEYDESPTAEELRPSPGPYSAVEVTPARGPLKRYR